jgi:hypothetical protein
MLYFWPYLNKKKGSAPGVFLSQKWALYFWPYLNLKKWSAPVAFFIAKIGIVFLALFK